MTETNKPIRVAAYCRVLTDSAEQLESLNNQMRHFEQIIADNPSWKLTRIYSDIGSGLNTKARLGYTQMVRDGNRHLFDLLLVKSLSRFGRDILEYIGH